MDNNTPQSHEIHSVINQANNHVVLTNESLDQYNPSQLVNDPSCGGISVFVGVTRDTFNGRRVKRLEYEAYHSMVIKQLENLAVTVRNVHPSLVKVFIAHRLGVVNIGEASVVIATSSPHRADCMSATEWMINQLKASVAIWKKEIYEDGETETETESTQHDSHQQNENATWKANPESFELIGLPPLMKQTTDFQLAGVIDEDNLDSI